jgi:hypothetical protein
MTIAKSESGKSLRCYDPPNLYGETGMIEAYEKLLDAHSDIFRRGDNKPQLVIVLDEAAILREAPSSQYLPSDVLCRAISSYSKCKKVPIWVVFASTEAKITEFAAPNIKCKW